MRIVWSSVAWADIDRLHAFLADQNPNAADAVMDNLAACPSEPQDFPRRGSRLSEFDPREIREFRVGYYLLRYELRGSEILVLKFFHAREDRPLLL
jgi:plasmid stabilization system protein ParE